MKFPELTYTHIKVNKWREEGRQWKVTLNRCGTSYCGKENVLNLIVVLSA